MKLPLTIIQGTNLARFQPTGNTMLVKGVLHRQRVRQWPPVGKTLYIARAPSHGTIFLTCGVRIGLTFNAQVHNVIAANGTVIYLNVPRPQGDGIPLGHTTLRKRNSRPEHTFLTSKRGLLPPVALAVAAASSTSIRIPG